MESDSEVEDEAAYFANVRSVRREAYSGAVSDTIKKETGHRAHSPNRRREPVNKGKSLGSISPEVTISVRLEESKVPPACKAFEVRFHENLACRLQVDAAMLITPRACPQLTDDEPELNQHPREERVHHRQHVGSEQYKPGRVLSWAQTHQISDTLLQQPSAHMYTP